jgi:hypothetical protein
MTFLFAPSHLFHGFGRAGLFASAVVAALSPGLSLAEGLGWRLPDLAKAAAEDAPAVPSAGWALPAASKSVPNAMGKHREVPVDRPVKRLFTAATVVITGFSGHAYGRPVLPQDQRAAARLNPDYQVIDLDGAVVTLSDIEGFGHAMNGDEVTRLADDALYARQIGQVFGAVLDDETAPNLYLSATSAFGLQIVGPDTDGDTLPDRLTTGDKTAVWMKGQWGYDPLSGPGTIWRVDGMTGQVAIFANLTHEGRENSGAALGNLAFDAAHDQLFASDLSTGLISRLDLRGTVVETFDHGVAARPAMGLAAEPYDSSVRADITELAFDSLDPATWGLAPDARRVWGLTVAEGRLFYAVAAGIDARPEVWSVGLDRQTGAFAKDPRWELTLADALPGHEISDIGFAADGAMVLAQRGPRGPKYDFTEWAGVGEAEVIRYSREAPKDDPLTPSVWFGGPETYAIGFAGKGANSTGGIAFGPAYDADGFLDFTQCRGTLWATGESLRDAPDLAKNLMPGGQMPVAGVFAQPVSMTRGDNSPPWFSYAHDRDGVYPDRVQQAFVGDVVVLGCDGAQLAASGGGTGGKGGDWTACAKDPKACKPKPKACASNAVSLACDKTTGTYVATIDQKPLFKSPFDRIKATDPSGKISSLPVERALKGKIDLPLAGLGAGQVGQIKLCSFDSAAMSAGLPSDCCNSTVEFKLPAKACVKEIQ